MKLYWYEGCDKDSITSMGTLVKKADEFTKEQYEVINNIKKAYSNSIRFKLKSVFNSNDDSNIYLIDFYSNGCYTLSDLLSLNIVYNTINFDIIPSCIYLGQDTFGAECEGMSVIRLAVKYE